VDEYAGPQESDMPRINGIDPIEIVGTRATTTDPVIDLGTNGNRIDLDTDNDSSIRASADDIIMFEAGGTDIGQISAGGIVLGVVSARASTVGTSVVELKTGTAPAGAATTTSGLFASSSVVRKIIADGTVSNVET
jgi:hypothetical protein